MSRVRRKDRQSSGSLAVKFKFVSFGKFIEVCDQHIVQA